MWHHQVDWMSYHEMHQGKERSVFCICRHGVIYHCVMICCSVIGTLLLSPNNPVENENLWSDRACTTTSTTRREFFVLCCNRCKTEAVMLYVCAKVLWNTSQHFGHICKLLANCIAYHPKQLKLQHATVLDKIITVTLQHCSLVIGEPCNTVCNRCPYSRQDCHHSVYKTLMS